MLRLFRRRHFGKFKFIDWFLSAHIITKRTYSIQFFISISTFLLFMDETILNVFWRRPIAEITRSRHSEWIITILDTFHYDWNICISLYPGNKLSVLYWLWWWIRCWNLYFLQFSKQKGSTIWYTDVTLGGTLERKLPNDVYQKLR